VLVCRYPTPPKRQISWTWIRTIPNS